MAEIYFYHLERQPLDAVLPRLLERTRERGWRALVKAASPERLAALDDHLWRFADESFLPHGSDREPDLQDQPILLTLGDENCNGAHALFLVDGAEVPPDISGYTRVMYLLDGADADAVARGRLAYRVWREAGHELSYWRQDEAAGWQNRGA